MNLTYYGRTPPKPSHVVVEFDGRKGREHKGFANPYQARRFYAAKLQAGKNPSLTTEAK